MQWFIDLSKIGQLCIERLEKNNVKVQTGSHGELVKIIILQIFKI